MVEGKISGLPDLSFIAIPFEYKFNIRPTFQTMWTIMDTAIKVKIAQGSIPTDDI